MSHSWQAYLPPHLAIDLLAHPDVSPLERVLRQPAVALFADISGFTPMSEALGQVGPSGTEELSQILNRTFGTMIDIIHAYGGSIGKFAGDALTVVFPHQARTQRASVRRAVQCGLAMQAAMGTVAEQQTSAGTFQLAMKIGVGMGSLLTTTVGDPAIRLEYLLAGSAIDQCAAAEQQAPNGAVVVTDELLPLLGGYVGVPVATGFHQVTQIRRRPREAPLAPPPLPEATTIASIVRYLPSSIVERLAQQQQGLVDEHRTVTTLFVRFAGFAYQDPEVLPQLQGYLREVVQINDRYGGYLRQVDVGDKGSLFIVLFGAPLAHEDDAERALLCALDLRAAAQQAGIVTATGITTGKIFCGMVGSHTRREYAAIGDSVNLAARLMSAARPDQILVDASTQQRTRSLFHWTTLPPLQVKGKSAPVNVAALDRKARRSTRRLRAPSYTLPMVGRQDELQHCFALLDRALQQQGQIVAISAEAGMGKSRLIAELMRSPQSKQFAVLTSECLSYGTQTSYLVWHALLRGLFDLTPDMSLDAQRQRVQTVLAAIDPMLVERMPLLGVALNLPIPDNELTRQLDAKLRKESLEQLLITCIRCWATQQPLLLILEDCHWIDPLSDDLLFALSQRIGDIPLLLLLTHRPFMTERSDTQLAGLRVSTLPYYQALTLTEFSRAETAELIQLKLAQLFSMREDAPAALVERIAERAQGNPFYIDELLNLLHDRGINPRDAAALLQVELPDSLQRLILSRIDRLEEGPKTALKLGSVIGRLFKAHWLWGIAPSLGAMTMQEHLQLLQERELTQLERVEPEVEYLFKHLITRDVAYESLSLATRTVLHEQVGAYIERTYAEELERWLDMLAYHYGQSANVTKQREYYRRAGDAAHAAFANAAAIHYYTQLLRVLPEEEHGPVQLELAVVFHTIGRYDEALDYNQRAHVDAEHRGDRPLLAQAARNRGDTLIVLGRYDAALAFLEQARTINTALQDQHGLVQTLSSLSWLALCQGDYTRTIAEGTACLELATTIGAYESCCRALLNMGVCTMDQEQYDMATAYFERSIQLANDHNLRLHFAVITCNLGVICFRLGKYDQAFAQQQQSLAAALSVGYHNQVLLALINLGSIYQEVGQEAEAQRCYQAALALMGEFPDPRQLSYVLMQLALVFGQQNDVAWVERLLQRAIRLCRAFELRYLLASSLATYTEHCLRQQRYGEAEQSNTEVLALTTQMQVRQGIFLSQVRVILLEVFRGQLPLVAGVQQLHTLRTKWPEPEQQALIDDTIWQLDPQQEQARRAATAAYHALYQRNCKARYRRRYAELTGEWLSLPPPFPDPPPIVIAHTIDIETVLQRVDRLLATRNG